MSSSDRTQLRLRIAGQVQGVGYREWMVSLANARGLSGWVRNRADGTVEAVLSGPKADVTIMLDACRQGPAAARVSSLDVETQDAADTPQATGFVRLPTL